MRILDKKFYATGGAFKYLAQACLAGMAAGAALLLFDVVRQPVVIASFGASAFIAFTMPHKTISRPRNLIGGYFVGITVGCVVHYLTTLPVAGEVVQKMLYVISGALAVASAMFLMTITDTEHAPATSIALGLVINQWTSRTIILILSGIIVISSLQRLLRRWTMDLL